MKNLIYLIIISISVNTFAQKTSDLFMTKEIRQSYDKETRSYEGIPGENYFINKIDYSIKANFNPATRVLSGKEKITYTNNSPDSLSFIYLNLYQDIYKKGNQRDFYLGTADITNGVQITKIIYNTIDIKTDSKEVINKNSILSIKLPEKIAPNSNSIIEINWNFILPGTVPVRMGTYNKDNFFIGLWFPKIAVYDDILGWNTKGHSGSQEFYNDFGNYDVEITVPDKYNVWATGVLQNGKDLYSNKYLNRINKSKETEDVLHIISKTDREKGDILKTKGSHVWKFKSENTPDFAFAISKTYIWDATSIKSGNRRISVNAVYKENSKDFHEVANISRNVIKFLSEEVPNLPYPYPQITAFNGGGGMEYPGMVNDGDASNINGTLYLTSHEIAHSFFPFSTGLNEQKYAWMDEGLITFIPSFFIERYSEDDYVFFKNNIDWYNKNAGTFVDVPLMISSDNINGSAYRFQSYNHSSVAFYLLYKYLGKEKFAKALKQFGEVWKGKHPLPYDFFYTFNKVAEEDLAWFWKPWFFEMGYADLSFKKTFKTEVNRTIIIIENKTGYPVPIDLTAEYDSGKKISIYKSMDIWKNNKKTYKLNVPLDGLKKLILNTETIPDAYENDNILEF